MEGQTILLLNYLKLLIFGLAEFGLIVNTQEIMVKVANNDGVIWIPYSMCLCNKIGGSTVVYYIDYLCIRFI